MKNKRIVKRHVLADKMPLVVAVALMLVAQYLPNLVVSSAIDSLYEALGEPGVLLQAYGLVVALFSIGLVLAFERWFYPEYEGSLKLDGFGRGMLASLPVILFVLAWLVFRLAMGYATFDGITTNELIQGIRAGVNEEAAFRGIAVALVLRQFKGEDNIWVAAVFVGVLFGCTHLLNLFSRDELANTALNTVFAAAAGIVFGVIFTLSGSLWPVAILHVMYDTIAFCVEGAEAAPDWPVFCEVAVFVVGAVAYLALLRRTRDKATTLWARKWDYKITNAN